MTVDREKRWWGSPVEASNTKGEDGLEIWRIFSGLKPSHYDVFVLSRPFYRSSFWSAGTRIPGLDSQ